MYGKDVRMTSSDLEALVAEILAAENCYAPGEWAGVEGLADALVAEAALLGVEPREYAAFQMRAIGAGVAEDGPFDEDEDLAGADRAMAAALVYVGRLS